MDKTLEEQRILAKAKKTDKVPGLQIVSSDGKVLSTRTKCVVHFKDRVETFDEFIAFNINDKTGKVTLIHNTDAATLGLAVECMMDSFRNAVMELDEETQKELLDYFEKRGTVHGQNRNSDS